MPTYSFRCPVCAGTLEASIPIGEYLRHPPAFFHCAKPMERYFPPVGGKALDNALAGDRSYDGLRAPDGSDISSRSKHREYMRRTGLTTADDFKDTWAQAEQKRNEYRTTGRGGAVTREDIARALARLDT
jgi:hypothetical protein